MQSAWHANISASVECEGEGTVWEDEDVCPDLERRPRPAQPVGGHQPRHEDADLHHRQPPPDTHPGPEPEGQTDEWMDGLQWTV